MKAAGKYHTKMNKIICYFLFIKLWPVFALIVSIHILRSNFVDGRTLAISEYRPSDYMCFTVENSSD